MAHANPSGGAGDGVPPTNNALIAVAAVLLAIPVVALCWVSSYSRETPRLGGVPFFFWYQFMWVFITAALTYTAHRLVLAARKPGAGTTGRPGRIGHDDPDDGPGTGAGPTTHDGTTHDRPTSGEGTRVEREDER